MSSNNTQSVSFFIQNLEKQLKSIHGDSRHGSEQFTSNPGRAGTAGSRASDTVDIIFASQLTQNTSWPLGGDPSLPKQALFIPKTTIIHAETEIRKVSLCANLAQALKSSSSESQEIFLSRVLAP